MGRVVTNTGISFNFGGTSLSSSGAGLQFGEDKEAFFEYNGNAGGTIVMEALGKQIAINVDAGTLRVNGENVDLRIGTGGVFRFIGGANGTVAELDGSGNLLLAGTIGTNITF